MDTNYKQQELSDYTRTLIRIKARQLVGKAGFTRDDIPDLEQEMMLALWERLPKFDSSKATLNTFSARIIEHKIQNIIRHRKQEIRDFRRESYSLDDSIKGVDGQNIERADLVDKFKVDARRGLHRRTREEQSQLRVDVSIVLSKLPDDLRQVAEHLKTKTPTETAKALGTPRTTIYRHIEWLQAIFEDKGLRDYL